MTPVLDRTRLALASARAIAVEVDAVRALRDDDLLALSAALGDLQRLVSTSSATVAGEMARRSAPALGHSGLAQRTGHRTPIELVRATAGSTARDAATAVRVGLLVHDAEPAPEPVTGVIEAPAQPWLSPVASALRGGIVGAQAAESIAQGLGAPDDSVTASALSSAAASLVADAAVLDPDRLFRRARALRDELDAAGVADRERLLRSQRSLTFRRLRDGSAQLFWRMDAETAAEVGDLYDRMTSPRRGGPRFVDPAAQARADALASDSHTTEQLASDVFAELLRHGADADSSSLLGSGAPVVRVLITEADLRSRDGIGWIGDHSDAISADTARRLACSGRIQLATLDTNGTPLDLSDAQRTFTAKQRAALTLIYGGCAFPGCERPPSFTEAHHIDWWRRDHGPTDLANGILLCRHHHLLIHDSGWELRRIDDAPWFVPPSEVDPARTPRPAQRRSPAVARLVRRAATTPPRAAG